MSLYTSGPSSFSHPFSYADNSGRRYSTLARVGTHVWESLTLSRSSTTQLEGMALTAQPPVLRRSTGDKAVGRASWWAVTEELVVTAVLLVAAGVVTKYLAATVSAMISDARASKDSKQDP
jgi:hypothetical protein